MNVFKSTGFLLLAVLLGSSANAQSDRSNTQIGKWESSSFTYGEFKAGYGLNQFSSGLNERFENGNFSNSAGGLASIAAYRKFEKLHYLHLGLRFKGLGAAPSTGDNGEEMFFNFWGTALSVKCFPLSKAADKGLYLQADYNFITQFTQKYRTVSALDFDHQFAIGTSIALGMGYQHSLKNGYGLLASVEYDWATRQGEVQGVGEQQFRSSHLAVQIGLVF